MTSEGKRRGRLLAALTLRTKARPVGQGRKQDRESEGPPFPAAGLPLPLILLLLLGAVHLLRQAARSRTLRGHRADPGASQRRPPGHHGRLGAFCGFRIGPHSKRLWHKLTFHNWTCTCPTAPGSRGNHLDRPPLSIGGPLAGSTAPRSFCWTWHLLRSWTTMEKYQNQSSLHDDACFVFRAIRAVALDHASSRVRRQRVELRPRQAVCRQPTQSQPATRLDPSRNPWSTRLCECSSVAARPGRKLKCYFCGLAFGMAFHPDLDKLTLGDLAWDGSRLQQFHRCRLRRRHPAGVLGEHEKSGVHWPASWVMDYPHVNFRSGNNEDNHGETWTEKDGNVSDICGGPPTSCSW